MSDPIRSISQNNYILATQQEVSHDNTLTGNGTPESPLGVANSSDETVLYQNDSGTSSTVNLTESPYNFEYVDIYISSVGDGVETMPVGYRVKIVSGKDKVAFGAPLCYRNKYGTCVNTAAVVLTIGDTISFLAYSTSGYSNKLYKVVGINRIANS